MANKRTNRIQQAILCICVFFLKSISFNRFSHPFKGIYILGFGCVIITRIFPRLYLKCFLMWSECRTLLANCIMQHSAQTWHSFVFICCLFSKGFCIIGKKMMAEIFHGVTWRLRGGVRHYSTRYNIHSCMWNESVNSSCERKRKNVSYELWRRRFCQ